MSNADERLRILNMVAEGRVSAEEGARLLGALSGAMPSAAGTPGVHDGEGRAKWFKVRVTDAATGRDRVNVTLPLGIVNYGLKLGRRFAPHIEGDAFSHVDLDDVADAIASGAIGRIVEVYDEDEGQRVEIFVE
ncbi:MAG: hypothetical protein IPG72_10170 [Ardenticatenales bacterium]|jgi:hypothetical protein|nr:hypothetical protein [Ardenticatenales bacterium]